MNTRQDISRDILWNALQECVQKSLLLEDEKKYIQEELEEILLESSQEDHEEQYGQRPMSEGVFDQFLDSIRMSGRRVN